MAVFCASLACPALLAQSAAEPVDCPLSSTQAELLRHLSHQDERPRVVIERLELGGYRRIADTVVDRVRAELLQKEYFADQDWLGEMENTVRFAWQDEGFFTVVVRSSSEYTRRKGGLLRFIARITINEGLQYRVGDLSVVNANPEQTAAGFPPELLRQQIPLRRGDLFSTEQVRKGLESLMRLYGSRGYIDFTATPQTDVDNATQVVNLTISLDPAVQYRLRAIQVSGADSNTVTALNSVFLPGEIIDTGKMRDYFSEHSSRFPADAWPRRAHFDRDPTTGWADLRLDLRPCPPGVN